MAQLEGKSAVFINPTFCIYRKTTMIAKNQVNN